MGVLSITITDVALAPVSADACVRGIIGLPIWTLDTHNSCLDVLEVTTVLLFSSELSIWVGYKAEYETNDFKYSHPNCSAPHRHMVGTCNLFIALVHTRHIQLQYTAPS
jgi:hypothetical protein